jgi:MFS family permease
VLAILAGYLGDRFNRIGVMIGCFSLTTIGAVLIGTGIMEGAVGIVIFNFILMAAGIYGVRSLYFAIMKEADIPFIYTGTAVGIISFVGYIPEVFISPWMGHLLDTYPGVEGHRFVFLLLALFAFAGVVIGLVLKRYVAKN